MNKTDLKAAVRTSIFCLPIYLAVNAAFDYLVVDRGLLGPYAVGFGTGLVLGLVVGGTAIMLLSLEMWKKNNPAEFKRDAD